MIRNSSIVVLTMVSLVATLPAMAAAQEEPTSLETIDWTLTRYLEPDSSELATVPFGVDATLMLDAGMASGSGGCNTFSGSYTIDAAALSFADELTSTLGLCDDSIQIVEDAYPRRVAPGLKLGHQR